MRRPEPAGRPPRDGYRKPTASALGRRRVLSPRGNAIPAQKHEHNAFPCAGSVYASARPRGTTTRRRMPLAHSICTLSPRRGLSPTQKRNPRTETRAQRVSTRRKRLWVSQTPQDGHRTTDAASPRHPHAQSSVGPLPRAETRSPRRNTSTTRFPAQKAFMRQPDPAGRPPGDGCREPTASVTLSPRRGRRGRRCAWRGRRR